MWTLRKTFRFEASHVLPLQGGKCARLHGHSWIGRVEVRGVALVEAPDREAGMIMDYGEMKKHITPLVDKYLDHHHLNETTGLENPTSEELARWILDNLKVSGLTNIVAVEIEETCTSWCRYEQGYGR